MYPTLELLIDQILASILSVPVHVPCLSMRIDNLFTSNISLLGRRSQGAVTANENLLCIIPVLRPTL